MTQGCCVDKACTPDTCMDLPAGKTCGDCHDERTELLPDFRRGTPLGQAADQAGGTQEERGR